MALDLIKNFGKYEKTILRHYQDFKDTYFKSNQFKRLLGRYDRLRASINLNFPSTFGRNNVRPVNEFMSKIAFPLVRERYLFRRAVIKHNYRQDPLVTIDPTGSTPIENSLTLQDVLNLNFKATKFRQRDFEKAVDCVSRYGCAVVYSVFDRSMRKIKRTVDTVLGPQQSLVPERRSQVHNHCIHILNYFQNSNIIDPEDSDIRGFIEKISISELIDLVKAFPRNYIKENLEEVIKDAKTSSLKDEYYHYDDKETKDFSKSGVDLTRVWLKLPIEGNEDDDTLYYMEVVGDKIIRFQDNPNDEDICNLTVLKIRNHPENWWGNCDPEDVMPHENFMHLFMNIKADLALKQLERYIFYPKGAIDTADINNRHIRGGWIPVDVKPGITSLPNMLWEFQSRDTNLSSEDWLLREIKESAQKMSTRPDFLRAGNKGGLANNTATAAGMLEQVGDYLEGDMLEVLSFGISEIGRKNAISLIQNLGERIAIRPDPKAQMREFYKSAIIGQYAFTVESCLQKSTVSEAIRLQNAITALLNFIGSGNPSFQNVNIVPVVRDWIRKLNVGDVDETYPEQAQMQATPGYVPSMQIPGQENAGAVQEMQPASMPQEAGLLNVA